jgi:hypothetical protein
MRNLHYDKIYFDTPWFLSLLTEFGINADPIEYKSSIRRFIIGEKLVPMADAVRREVARQVDFPMNFEDATNVDTFFAHCNSSLLEKIHAHGIDPNCITRVESFEQDNESKIDVTFTTMETDEEVAIRQRKADVFNMILINKDAIYGRIDSHLAANKSTPS